MRNFIPVVDPVTIGVGIVRIGAVHELIVITKAIGFLIPCEVRVLDLKKLDEAKDWLRGKTGAAV